MTARPTAAPREGRRPRVLDLFCCAGGAGAGYSRAGFDVVGVDIVPRSNYPFEFIEGDALDALREMCQDFDLVHASPPCQSSCTLTKGTNKGRRTYVDLIPEVRELCRWYGVPWVIENVPGSSIRRDLTLCGESFGLGVIRHRYFEIEWWGGEPEQMPHPKHRGPVRGIRHGVWKDGPYIAAYGKGGGKGTVAEMQAAMDIHWTDVHEELTEAIPPAYTQYIGHAFLADWGAALRGEPDTMPIPEIMRPYLTHDNAGRLRYIPAA
ncbi:DNA methylase [Kitasatospora sp. NPDC088134]|uniref:DNA methylase n=1 Tax=Kitasatospora sp. NPDC088134 TaxID=3364071 RepID=UPI00382C3EB7